MKKTVLFAVLALFGVTAAFAQESIDILEFPPDEYILPILVSPPEPIFEGLLYEVVFGRAGDMTITIISYNGNAVTLNIPEYIEGFSVTAIRRLVENWAGRNENNNLTSITIPFSVTSLGDPWELFGGCKSLTSIIVDNRNSVYSSIDGVLFDKNIRTLIFFPQGRNQRTYIIPSSVMSVGNSAFRYCDKLIGITIPSSVTSIGDQAFFSCHNLTSITIPSSVTSIGDQAFFDCRSLTSITIPSSVASIGIGAFFGCDRLTSVTLSRRTQLGAGAFSPSTRITYSD